MARDSMVHLYAKVIDIKMEAWSFLQKNQSSILCILPLHAVLDSTSFRILHILNILDANRSPTIVFFQLQNMNHKLMNCNIHIIYTSHRSKYESDDAQNEELKNDLLCINICVHGISVYMHTKIYGLSTFMTLPHHENLLFVHSLTISKFFINFKHFITEQFISSVQKLIYKFR